MTFLEKKKKNGYSYDLEDVFGSVHIESNTRLIADILDEIIVLLLKQKTTAETVNGKVKDGDRIIKYTFKKAKTWEDDDECENIPTSTNEQVSGTTSTSNQTIRTLSWLQRFAVACQRALKKIKH